jgi:peptidoglycan/xylan/chitin deacetylase (PgdA/CDA1 family)
MARLSGLGSALKQVVGGVARWSGVVTLAYHRIGDGRTSPFDRGLWSATAEGFDEQLRWLSSHFDVVAPRDLPYVVRTRRGRHVIITFDDGYADNYATAYPILRAHRLPATFFVSTGFVDRPRLPWWDEIAWMIRRSDRPGVELPRYLPAPLELDEPTRERAIRLLLQAYKRLPSDETDAFVEQIAAATGGARPAAEPRGLWMTWDMLREMHAGGMTIGGHTVNHPILARMSPAQQWDEIAGCARRLEAELGVPMRAFAYPVGSRCAFDRHTRECLDRLGVRAAFSYYGGFRPVRDWDPLDIPRIAVEQDQTAGELRAAVLLPALTSPRGGGVPRAPERGPLEEAANGAVKAVPCLTPAHRRLEDELCRVTASLPLAHRSVWQEGVGRDADLFFGNVAPGGRCDAGLVVEVAPSRALPGHHLLRVQRYTPCGDGEVERRLLRAVRDHAARDRRVLRLAVEIYSLEEEGRTRSERILAELGFVRADESRRYEHTLVLDLRPDEASLMNGLHRSARRNIREVAKHPVEVKVIDDERLANRITALQNESLRRTGAGRREHDWAARIALGRRAGSLSRIVGLFRTDVSGPEALVAFAWGCSNGDHAHYEASGATRSSGLRMSLAYPLVWDLICWAKAGSATWFDLGGVTVGHLNDGADPLGGISDFKRYFSRRVVQVGSEWTFEPRPRRAALARTMSEVGRQVSRVARAG